MASSLIPVEVKGEQGEHYPALLCKVTPDDLVVTFNIPQNDSLAVNNSSEEKQKLFHFPYDRVRLAPVNSISNSSPTTQQQPTTNTNTLSFDVGKIVEVCLKSNFFNATQNSKEEPLNTNNNSQAVPHQQNNKLSSLIYPRDSLVWWKAEITKVTKELLGITMFYSPDGIHNLKHTDIVECSQIRLPNEQPYFTNKSLHSHVIEFDSTVTINNETPELVDLVRRLQGPVLVNFDEESHQLTLVSTDKNVIRRVSLLKESFLRLIQQKQVFYQTSRREDNKAVFAEVFTLDSGLIGMAIGYQGRNISEARAVPGIDSIYLDDESKTFFIHGKTMEAVTAAREKLEFMREIIDVPQIYANKIINMLQEVVDKSQVIRIYVAGDPSHKGADHVFPNGMTAPFKEGYSSFQIVGRRSQIDDARLLIDYNVYSLCQLDEVKSQCDSSTTSFGRDNETKFHQNFDGNNYYRESSLPPMSRRGGAANRGGGAPASSGGQSRGGALGSGGPRRGGLSGSGDRPYRASLSGEDTLQRPGMTDGHYSRGGGGGGAYNTRGGGHRPTQTTTDYNHRNGRPHYNNNNNNNSSHQKQEYQNGNFENQTVKNMKHDLSRQNQQTQSFDASSEGSGGVLNDHNKSPNDKAILSKSARRERNNKTNNANRRDEETNIGGGGNSTVNNSNSRGAGNSSKQ